MRNEQNQSDAKAHPVDTLVKCGCVCITDATKSQQDFWNTYSKQSGYKKYTVETFVKDSLYGLGIALNKSEFEGCDGFDKFKAILKEYLNT